MPLVTIQSLPPRDQWTISTMLADVRDSGAAALRCLPDNIWVLFQPVQAGHYLQGGEPAMGLRNDSHPPIVIVRAQVGRTKEEKERLVVSVVSAVARGLSVPEKNVWVHYQEMERDRHDVD